MRKSRIGFISLILVALFSCTSIKDNFTYEGGLLQRARIAYREGDYITTVKLCVESLAIDPFYYEAKALLDSSYSKSIRDVEDRDQSIKSSNRRFINEELYNLYSEVSKIYSDIKLIDPELYSVDFKDKLDIYREKAAIDYYNQGVDDSLNVTIGSDNRCFEYFIKAKDIWGEEYLDSFTIAASVLYRKAELLIKVGNKNSIIEAISKLEEIESWVDGYKDSRSLIEILSNKIISYYVVVGDNILTKRIEPKIKDLLIKSRNNYIELADNKTIMRHKLSNEESIIDEIKNSNISTTIYIKTDNIEYTPSQKEARFKIETRRYWIDEDNSPLEEVDEELVDYWHENLEYREKLLKKGVHGYKDFFYSYIINSEFSNLKLDIVVNLYSNSLGLIGSIATKGEYRDYIQWKEGKNGDSEIFPELLLNENKSRMIMDQEELLSQILNNVNIDRIVNESYELLLEDNPMDKKIY